MSAGLSKIEMQTLKKGENMITLLQRTVGQLQKL